MVQRAALRSASSVFTRWSNVAKSATGRERQPRSKTLIQGLGDALASSCALGCHAPRSGWRSGGLQPVGVRQAERLRDRLATTGEIKADTLIASPLPRARQTAELLASTLGLPVMQDADVEEWRNEDGSLSQEAFMERVMATPSEQMPVARFVPGGENWLEFSVRAAHALTRSVREYADQTTVIVCHGGIIEVSLSLFFGLSGASLQRLNVESGHTSITHWQKVTPPPGFLSDWLLER
jgi:2,3-bisphosphoglycerate-dependent phosphoglycerate mutase